MPITAPYIDNPFEWLTIDKDIHPTPISIPSGLPLSITNRIFLRFRGFVPDFERIRISNLLNDSRLKDVFHEILKDKKTANAHPSTYFRPVIMDLEELYERCQWREPFESTAEQLVFRGASDDAHRLLSNAPERPEATDWGEIQQLAAYYLFLKLDEYSNGMDRPVVVKASEVTERQREVLRVKAPLAEAALALRSKGLLDEAAWLDKAAWHWELKVYEGWENDTVELLRPRKKYPEETRGCVRYFAEVMKELFGMNMPSIIAKLSGLAVPSIRISRKDVETILKIH